MLDDRDATTRSCGSRSLGWIAWALGLIGAAALAWTAFQLEDAREYQQAAREALNRAAPTFEIGTAEPPVESAPRVDTARLDHDASMSGRDSSNHRRPAPSSGAPLGALSIPRLHLSVVVLHGTDGLTLRRGVGHIEQTAMPGELGNVGIAGHRDSFFRPLRHVQLGDEVLLETAAGRLRYRVESLRVVGPSDVDVLDSTSDATLTLVTCYPFSYFGAAPDRFVVRATRVAEAPSSFTVAANARGIRASTTDRSHVVGSPADPGNPRNGDESVILQAIERFRVVYNGVLARSSEARSEGPVLFGSCRVTVEGNEALARCEATRSSDPAPAVWTFNVVRNGLTWSVKSIAPQ